VTELLPERAPQPPAALVTPRSLPVLAEVGLRRIARLAGSQLDADSASVIATVDGTDVTATWSADAGAPAPDLDLRALDDRVRLVGAAVLVPAPGSVAGAGASYLGVPLRDHEGHVLGVLSVATASPRRWTPAAASLLAELAGLAEDARAVSGELAVTVARLGLVAAAARIGTWEWDLDTGRLTWDERSAALHGASLAEATGSMADVESRVHPADLLRLQEALGQAAATLGSVEVEVRVRWPDGSVHWLLARGQTLADPAGRAVRMLGANIDVTEQHRAAEVIVTAARRSAVLADVAVRLTEATDEQSIIDIIVTRGLHELGEDGGCLLRVQPDGSTGRLWGAGEVPPELVARHRLLPLDDRFAVTAAATSGQPVLGARPADPGRVRGDEAALAAMAAVPLLGDGVVLGALGVGWATGRVWAPGELDVVGSLAASCVQALLRVESGRRLAQALERESAARREAELAASQLGLLSAVSETLSATLDADEAVARLVRLVVPALADWAMVTVVDETGAFHNLGSLHRDPARTEEVARFAAARLAVMTPQSPVATVLRTNRPVVLTGLELGDLDHAVDDGGVARLLRDLDPSALAVLPVGSRQGAFGVLTLVTSAGRGAHTAAELRTAAEVARRAGVALESARLFARSQRVAETLQRSLLAVPSPSPRLAVASRYVPAVTDASVGGDFYDAFTAADGSDVLVIGDVMGHDIEAAALMGQLRTIVRTAAAGGSPTPATVLTRVDQTAAAIGLDTTASTLVAQLWPLGDGAAELRWSNAGHLPPVVLTAQGHCAPLGSSDDLLLGIDPSLGRLDHSARLEPGATLLLFTDGLVERRGSDLDAGLERLAEAAHDLGRAPLEVLCDVLLDRLVGRGDDDVALLAVRLRD